MIKACSDIAAAHVAALSPQLPIAKEFLSKLPSGADWYAENRVSDSHAAATADGCQPFGNPVSNALTLNSSSIRKLHVMFREYVLSPEHRYNVLFNQFTATKAEPRKGRKRPAEDAVIREANGSIFFASDKAYILHLHQFSAWAAEQPDTSAADKHMCLPLDGRCTPYKAAMIGADFRLAVGGWFLARPSAMSPAQRGASLMWFGHVEAVLQMKSPFGKDITVLQVPHHIPQLPF